MPQQKRHKFYIRLKSTCCLFVAYCHEFRNMESYDGFENLLFDSLITRQSFENISCLSSCSVSQRWIFRRIRSNILLGIESDLAYTKVSWVVFQYVLRSGNFWHQMTMLRNK